MPGYTSAVRQATLAAARLHRDLGSEAVVTRAGSSVDIFGVVARLRVPMLLRPLKGLLGAFLSDPLPGILITTERPLSIQRFTGNYTEFITNEQLLSELRKASSNIPAQPRMPQCANVRAP